jgi:hypothetical protein
MNPATLATNAAPMLGAASAVGYACGSLVLRARAFALGTDPTFQLVDEIYVFAGFRFLVITLLLLVVTAPVLLALRALLAWSQRSLPGAVQWMVVLVLSIATLAAMGILTVDAVLLRGGDVREDGLAMAVLGGATGLRFGLSAGIVLLAAVTGLSLQGCWGTPGRTGRSAVLAALLALQAFLLPVYHGALFADRRAWVLSDVPASVQTLRLPLAIVDRTAGEATLLGADAEGRRGLVTIPRADLAGIPLREIVPLRDFLQRLGGGSVGGDTRMPWFPEGSALADTPAEARRGATGWRDIVAYLGVVLDAIGSLGDDEAEAGELWLATLDASGRALESRRVGAASDVSWPVTDPTGGYLALQAGRLVRLDAAGEIVAVVDELPRWRRLIGVDGDGTALGLLMDGGATRLAVITPDGAVRINPGPPDTEEDAAIAALTTNARAHDGNRALIVDRSARSGRGFDVYLRSPEGRANLSDCDPDSCQQPSFGSDFRSVVYIRVPRF